MSDIASEQFKNSTEVPVLTPKAPSVENEQNFITPSTTTYSPNYDLSELIAIIIITYCCFVLVVLVTILIVKWIKKRKLRAEDARIDQSHTSLPEDQTLRCILARELSRPSLSLSFTESRL